MVRTRIAVVAMTRRDILTTLTIPVTIRGAARNARYTGTQRQAMDLEKNQRQDESDRELSAQHR